MISFRIVRGVQAHFMVRLVEWLNAAILLNFGVTLLRTGETFSTSHSYDVMAAIASEDTWGWVLTAVAGIRMTALFLNGSVAWFWHLSPWARVLMAYLSAFAWFALSTTLFWGNSMAPGAGTYLIHMGSDIFIAGVVAREASRLSAGGENGRAK